jgi:hypothetical protein
MAIDLEDRQRCDSAANYQELMGPAKHLLCSLSHVCVSPLPRSRMRMLTCHGEQADDDKRGKEIPCPRPTVRKSVHADSDACPATKACPAELPRPPHQACRLHWLPQRFAVRELRHEHPREPDDPGEAAVAVRGLPPAHAAERPPPRCPGAAEIRRGNVRAMPWRGECQVHGFRSRRRIEGQCYGRPDVRGPPRRAPGRCRG